MQPREKELVTMSELIQIAADNYLFPKVNWNY